MCEEKRGKKEGRKQTQQKPRSQPRKWATARDLALTSARSEWDPERLSASGDKKKGGSWRGKGSFNLCVCCFGVLVLEGSSCAYFLCASMALTAVMSVCTTDSSARVEVSPSAPSAVSWHAILRRSRRMILPDRVLGMAAVMRM